LSLSPPPLCLGGFNNVLLVHHKLTSAPQGKPTRLDNGSDRSSSLGGNGLSSGRGGLGDRGL